MTDCCLHPMKEPRSILVVEDSNEDFEALKRFVGRSSALPGWKF